MTGYCVQNIQNLPLWIKQVLYKEVKADLEVKLGEFEELLDNRGLFQYLLVNLTLKGSQELNSKSMNLSPAFYTFMQDASSGSSILDITVRNNWTLTDTAKIFIRLNEYEFLKVSGADFEQCLAVAGFICGKIRIGELLKKIGKIDAIQIDKALRFQKQADDEGRHIKMASILVKMGFVSEKGLDSLILLKEEAKRRIPSAAFLNSIDATSANSNLDDNVVRMQKELSRLENENIILQKRLKKILNLE